MNFQLFELILEKAEEPEIKLPTSAAAAAAAKLLQLCLTLCNPRDGSPPGSPVPGILQARIPKKQESSRKTSISTLLIMPKPLTVESPQTVENSERDGNTRPPDLPLEKSVCRSGSNS